LFYAWAEKNSRPQIPSNERKRNKFNGLLCVDVITGEEYLKLTERAKTEDIVSYFTELCRNISQQGFHKITIILDNNSTHKTKMKNLLQEELFKLGISSILEIEFIHTPPYSPDYNLVEYLIHQLRLTLLHHQPVGTTIEMIRAKIHQHLLFNHLQTPEQIQNTIAHILALAK
jgi:transposase